MKQAIAFLLAALLLATLPSCGKKGAPGIESGRSDTEPSGTEPEENKDAVLGIPDDLKYDGIVSVLMYDSSVPEYCDTEKEKPDSIEQALRSRDSFVETRLGVAMRYTKMSGQWGKRNEFSDTVRKSVQGGSGAWELVGTYSMVAPNLATNHVLTDMRTLRNPDFSKVWYPKFMVDASTINGKTYFISGDVSTNLLYSMQGVAFSERQASVNGIREESLYQMVYDNEWTMEALFSMCEDLGRELDGDGIWDNNDFYPIIAANDSLLDSFYFASGLTLIDENEDGILEVSDDVLSEKVLAIYSTVYNGINTYRSFNNPSNDKAIVDGKCIFSISPIFSFRTVFTESKERYRILPFPKFEVGAATPYRTLLSMWHTQFCIPNDIADPNRAAAVLETLGYASYIYVMPVIFDTTLKLRYSENGDCAKMFDIMRQGCVFDVGSLFYMTFEGNNYLCAHSMFRDAVQNRITNWVSAYNNRFKTGLENVTARLNEFYAD